MFNRKGNEASEGSPPAKVPKPSTSSGSTMPKQTLLNVNSFRSPTKQKTPAVKQTKVSSSTSSTPLSSSPTTTHKTNSKESAASRLSQFAHSSKAKKSNSPFQTTKRAPQKELVTKVADIKSKPKYTPMEKQVIQLWKNHPGIVLAVEVGYRFMFIGEDAIKASKILHFILTPAKGSSHFPHCSVPAVTIHVHLHRLVNAGLKVGIVTQTETRALKKASNNRNNPFERKLTQIYTKGTFISPKIDCVTEDGNEVRRKSGAADSGFLLCFCESDAEQSDKNRETEIAFVAVNVCTGEIIWDCFKDEFLRSELENRLASVRPTELIIPETKFLSTQTEALIDQYYKQNYLKESMETDSTEETYSFQHNAIRIERVSCVADQLMDTVRNFYGSDDIFEQFPALVVQCIGLMINYLTPFSLQKLLQLRNNFTAFSHENIVPLDRNVIEQLEILESVGGSNTKANLFWLIDVTLTPFGSRLLRSWLLHPMKNETLINERLNAVEEIIEHGLEPLKKLLQGLPDLERGICRMFYHKCEPLEFISIMRSFMNAFKNLALIHSENFSSELMTKTISAIPDLSEDVSSWLSCLSFDAARSGKYFELFQVSHLAEDPYPDITATKATITAVEEKLNDTLAQLRSDTGFSRLKFTTVATDEYLLELTHKQAEKVNFYRN